MGVIRRGCAARMTWALVPFKGGILSSPCRDSRLRGNDVGVCGNDVGVCGNDVGVCGNDVGVCGNDVGVCGNDVGVGTMWVGDWRFWGIFWYNRCICVGSAARPQSVLGGREA